MSFQLHIAKMVIGYRTHTSLQTIALEALDEGLDSPSLRILAGLANNEYPSIVDHYFYETLKELEIELPNKKTAAIEVAVWIVDEINAGRKSVFEGTKELIDKTINVIAGDKKNTFYAYDSIAFEKAYGLFYTIDDLQDVPSPWMGGRPVKDLEEAATMELLIELKKWAITLNSQG